MCATEYLNGHNQASGSSLRTLRLTFDNALTVREPGMPELWDDSRLMPDVSTEPGLFMKLP